MKEMVHIERGPDVVREDMRDKETFEYYRNYSMEPPDILCDMKFVLNDNCPHPPSAQQRNLMKMLKDDPKGFLVQMTGLEKSYRQTFLKHAELREKAKEKSQAKRRSKGGQSTDVSEAAALALLSEVLQEIALEKTPDEILR